MSCYVIKQQSRQISANKLTADGSLHQIRFDGEAAIELPKFWEAFKDKIEYEESELLSFILLSHSGDTFSWDETISIAEEMPLSKETVFKALRYFLRSDLEIVFKPDVSWDVDSEFNATENLDRIASKETALDPELAESDGSLQAFFKKKTSNLRSS